MNRDTICVQGGYTPGNGEPRQIPIIQSTTFKYATSEDMGKLFDLEARRLLLHPPAEPHQRHGGRPRSAELEGGTAAMLTSSRSGCQLLCAVQHLRAPATTSWRPAAIYGGTFNLFSVTMKKMGIDRHLRGPDCAPRKSWMPPSSPTPRSCSARPSPTLPSTVLDIEKFAKAAHAHGVPLIVDNTFPTPVNCRPFEWGADIVTHSTTKYMDGHGAAAGRCHRGQRQVRLDGPRRQVPRPVPLPTRATTASPTPSASAWSGAFITKATAQLMRDFGSIQSPHERLYAEPRP